MLSTPQAIACGVVLYTGSMFWQYTRRDSKVLLLATLLVFSAYGLLLARDLGVVERVPVAPAQTIGVYAGVEQNEYNTIAAELSARADELDAREAALRGAPGPRTDTTTLLAIVCIGAGLLGLILLNFYLDSKRRRSLAG